MLALIHAQLHKQARERYLRILNEFKPAELEIIIRFLNAITESIKSQ